MYRADDTTKEQFLIDLKRTSEAPGEFLVVSYDRGTLGQTGTGHFSPIGGYSEKDGMVLVLDVARFKYPAYWVSVDLLWDSLQPIDPDTGKSRGYILLSRDCRHVTKSALSQLAVNRDSWPHLARSMTKTLPEDLAALPSGKITTAADFISFVLDHIPDEYSSVVENRLPLFLSPPAEDGSTVPDASVVKENAPSEQSSSEERMNTYMSDLDTLLHRLSETELYKIIKQSISLKRKHKAREKMLELAAATVAKEEEADAAAAVAVSLGAANGIVSPASAISFRRMASFRDGTWSAGNGSPTGGFGSLGGIQEGRVWHTDPNSADPSGVATPVTDSRRTSVLSMSAGGWTPSHYVPPAFRRLSRARSSVTSLMSMHPPEHPVNDFTAFLTVFLFAVFEYWPQIWKGSVEGTEGLERVVSVPKEGESRGPHGGGVLCIREEVEFLKGQIDALMELVGDLDDG
ncbi:hypothetical protein HDV00_003533 [Rhizophlyctis rosea]|nr:hypothetical protein HDV00_003533 [Rhizophlyctis rosea]